MPQGVHSGQAKTPPCIVIMSSGVEATVAGPQVPEGYVKLISSDGYEFIIETRYAQISSVLRAMLSSPYNATFQSSAIHRVPNASALLTFSIRLFVLPGPILASFHPAGHFLEAHTRVVSLPTSGVALEKLCQYLHYQRRRHFKARLTASGASVPGDSGSETFSVPPELALETFNAAVYLEL